MLTQKCCTHKAIQPPVIAHVGQSRRDLSPCSLFLDGRQPDRKYSQSWKQRRDLVWGHNRAANHWGAMTWQLVPPLSWDCSRCGDGAWSAYCPCERWTNTVMVLKPFLQEDMDACYRLLNSMRQPSVHQAMNKQENGSTLHCWGGSRCGYVRRHGCPTL